MVYMYTYVGLVPPSGWDFEALGGTESSLGGILATQSLCQYYPYPTCNIYNKCTYVYMYPAGLLCTM